MITFEITVNGTPYCEDDDVAAVTLATDVTAICPECIRACEEMMSEAR